MREPSTTTEYFWIGALQLIHQHNGAPFSMEMTREQLADITALFEDTAEYYCDDNIISGQKFWTVLECMATAKLAELNGELG